MMHGIAAPLQHLCL